MKFKREKDVHFREVGGRGMALIIREGKWMVTRNTFGQPEIWRKAVGRTERAHS